jgi:hypothetical protein
MQSESFLNISFGVVAGFKDQPALDCAADDGLERRAGLDLDAAARVEQLLIAGVAQLEPVVGIIEGEALGGIEGEALGGALDGVDQPLPRRRELLGALFNLVLEAGKAARPCG